MMKRWIVPLCVAVLALASATAGNKKPGKGFWKILVTPNAKWVLHGADHKGTITVETYDVRKVGGASVARLRWSYKLGEDTRDIGSADSTFTQVAVTNEGLYLSSADLDDAEVSARLKKKPSRSDPPKPYKGTNRNDGRYLTIKGDLVCLGSGPSPGDGDCDDVCYGELCISATDGIVTLDGTWSPSVDHFGQPGY